MNISSVLASAFSGSSSGIDTTGTESASSAEASSVSSSSVDFSSMTIAQIRELTDQMAMEGKLTDRQQIFLISVGLQDMDANDTSVQSVGPGSPYYTTSDSAIYNLNDLLSGYAQFYRGMSDTRAAEVITSTEQTIDAYEANPSPVECAASVNTIA